MNSSHRKTTNCFNASSLAALLLDVELVFSASRWCVGVSCAAVCIRVLNVFVEPYTVREARIHTRHVRDLLKSVGLQDAYAGLDCNSVSLLNIVTNGNLLG